MNWRLSSWTYIVNTILILVGAFFCYKDKIEIGMIFVTMGGANLGLREKTQKKVGE